MPTSDNTSVATRAIDRYKGWPLWARIVAPMTALIVVIGALGGSGGEEPVEASATHDTAAESTTTTEKPEFVDPVEQTSAVLQEHESRLGSLSHDQLVEVVATACDELNGDGSTEAVADSIYAALDAELTSVTASALDGLGDILSDTAPELCPDGVRAHPQLVRALVTMAPTTTTTTTAAPTTTTTAPPTTTTAPPPPPTTAAPLPPPPPTTAAPAPSTYYANCTEAKAAGAAPVYRGDPGYSSRLDRDNDGIGCES